MLRVPANPGAGAIHASLPRDSLMILRPNPRLSVMLAANHIIKEINRLRAKDELEQARLAVWIKLSLHPSAAALARTNANRFDFLFRV